MSPFQTRGSLIGAEGSFINVLCPLCHHLGLGQPALSNGLLRGCIRDLYYTVPLPPLGASQVREVRADQIAPALHSSVLTQYPMSKDKIFTFTSKAHLISPLADSQPLPLCPSLSSSWLSTSFSNALASSLPSGCLNTRF